MSEAQTAAQKQKTYLTVHLSGFSSHANILQEFKEARSMSVSFLLLLLVVSGEMCGGMGFMDSGTEVSESSAVNARMDKMERLLYEQDAKLVHQGNLLRLQDALLRQQNVELSRLGNLLGQQDAKLSRQESVLRQQGAMLANQENLLRLQETLLRQQDAKLSHQESLLHRQDAKLSHQENLLRQHDAKLSRQETLLFRYGKLIQQLKAEKLYSRSELRNRPTSDKLRQLLPETLTVRWYDVTNDIEPATVESDDTVTSAAHDVMSRSDDGGPLEAVVSHISQQVTEMSADIQVLKSSNSQQDRDIQDAQSSTFVHWGSSQCSSSSQLVYSGVMGGSWFQHSGAATNYLCLTLSPVFSNQQPPSVRAYLYGGEYETFDSHMDKDPVCSVCRSTFSTTLMIPGTNVCTPGWHLQYSGFLMAGEPLRAAGSEYICVDSRLQARLGSDPNHNGKMLYYTIAQCGSLPCEPYVQDKVVLCAVCSK